MVKQILLTASVLLCFQTQAEIRFAQTVGLPWDTGYLRAVTADEKCDPSSDVLVSKGQYDFMAHMRKCDGSIIGWVELQSNGTQLSHLRHYSDQWDFELAMPGAVPDNMINIYTCDSSRADELESNARADVTPFRDPQKNYRLLKHIQRHKLNFKITLFYNEYVLSGKCIGNIEILK